MGSHLHARAGRATHNALQVGGGANVRAPPPCAALWCDTLEHAPMPAQPRRAWQACAWCSALAPHVRARVWLGWRTRECAHMWAATARASNTRRATSCSGGVCAQPGLAPWRRQPARRGHKTQGARIGVHKAWGLGAPRPRLAAARASRGAAVRARARARAVALDRKTQIQQNEQLCTF